MNKILLFFLSAFLFCGCTSFTSKVDIYTFKPLALETTMKLGTITIEPAHAINGIEVILPEIITSVARENGILLLPMSVDSSLSMDVYLHRKSYLKGFEKYESVTLILKIKNSDGIVANAVFTEDSKTPLDSFSKLYKIFKEIMPKLQKEYITIQKQIEKGETL